MKITGLPYKVERTLNKCASLPLEIINELCDLWKIVEQGGQKTPPEIAFDEPVYCGDYLM